MNSAAVPFVLGVGADREALTAETGDAGTGDAGKRRHVEPASDLGRAVGLVRERIHGRPVAEEDQFSFLEGLPALFLLPGDGRLGNGAVLERVGQQGEALLRLGSVDVRLAIGVGDHATGAVHRLGEVDGQTFVLLELAAVAVELRIVLAGLDLLAGRLHLVPGGRCREVVLVQQILAVEQQSAVGGVGDAIELAEVGRGVDSRLEETVGAELVRGQWSQVAIGGEAAATAARDANRRDLMDGSSLR